MRIIAYVNAVNIFKLNPKVGCCLAARDYKGFGTRWNYMNGVIDGGGYERRRLPDQKINS